MIFSPAHPEPAWTASFPKDAPSPMRFLVLLPETVKGEAGNLARLLSEMIYSQSWIRSCDKPGLDGPASRHAGLLLGQSIYRLKEDSLSGRSSRCLNWQLRDFTANRHEYCRLESFSCSATLLTFVRGYFIAQAVHVSWRYIRPQPAFSVKLLLLLLCHNSDGQDGGYTPP